jgi:hypothetical protein
MAQMFLSDKGRRAELHREFVDEASKGYIDSITTNTPDFNVFNHPNFGLPDGFSAASTFGQIIYTASPPNGIFGRGVSARMIQVKAQLEF